jgi:hypothetical protein
MEKGNGSDGSSTATEQQAGAGGSAAGGGPAPGAEPAAGGGADAAPPTGNPPPSGGGGGGAQADQSGPAREPLDIDRQEFPPTDGYPGYEVGPTTGGTGQTDAGQTDTGQAEPAGAANEADASGGASAPPPDERTQRILADRQRALSGGARSETYPDGAQLKVDGAGGAEYTDGSKQARFDGTDWVDPKTGQRVDRGTWAKADHRLRQLGQ